MRSAYNEPTLFKIDRHFDKKDAGTLRNFNSALKRLNERRVKQISISGPLLKSKLAWKIATYQQPVLYRVVMLASGCALTWNARNTLSCYLTARALIEIVAVLLEFEYELESLISNANLEGINALTTNRIFSSRDVELTKDLPEITAINVQTFINKLDKREMHGLRGHYDILSERCHPNSFGHHQFFGSLDHKEGIITYSDVKWWEKHLKNIIAAVILIQFAEKSIERLDDAILRVAELQQKYGPKDNWEKG